MSMIEKVNKHIITTKGHIEFKVTVRKSKALGLNYAVEVMTHSDIKIQPFTKVIHTSAFVHEKSAKLHAKDIRKEIKQYIDKQSLSDRVFIETL